jgi:hypothetical protein
MTADGKALTRFALSTLTRQRLYAINLSSHGKFANIRLTRTYPQSKLFWNNSHTARPCDNDACRRADPASHTDKAFDAGSFGSTCPDAFSRTLHRHCTAVPPSTRPTFEAGTGMAYAQVARPHYTGSGARRAQSRRGRACLHRSSQSKNKNGALIVTCLYRDHVDAILRFFRGRVRRVPKRILSRSWHTSRVHTRAIVGRMTHAHARRSLTTVIPALGTAHRRLRPRRPSHVRMTLRFSTGF